MRRLTLVVTALAAVSALAEEAGAERELVAEKTQSRWHFRIGPVMAPRVRVRVRGPRHISPVPTFSGSSAYGTVDGVAADPSAGYADRVYADGFVRPDEGTDDPGSFVSGLTWDWGAADVGSQYSGGKMEFRTDMAGWSETVSASSYGGGGSLFDGDRDILLGVEAMGGWTFYAEEAYEAAIDAGFRFYGSGDLSSRSKYGTSVTTTRNEYRYVDSYSAVGWTDVPSGSYEGTPGGPGRLIGASPSRRRELMGSTSSSETYYYHSSTKLDYRIWDLRLGPTLGWKAFDRLTLRGGVYGLLGIVDAKLRTSVETADGARYAKKSKCDALFGVAAGFSAQVNLTESMYLVGGVEYDWWSDAMRLRSGGTSARIKLSDFTVSLALGMDF